MCVSVFSGFPLPVQVHAYVLSSHFLLLLLYFFLVYRYATEMRMGWLVPTLLATILATGPSMDKDMHPCTSLTSSAVRLATSSRTQEDLFTPPK